MSDEKLQKVLAAAGWGSRRELEREIAAGQIKVNGRAAILGQRVGPGDKIQFQGRTLTVPEASRSAPRVLLYNKPEGEICSRNDPEGRPTVYDRLPVLNDGRWVSVGRLDFNTSGLLLFTDDGELANKLMHPSSELDREYLVRVMGPVTDEILDRLREGVLLEDGMARFTDVQRNSEGQGSNNWFLCVVREGRNREVRRLWESQNLKVSRLKRVRYGPIIIPPFVGPGQWLELDDKSLVELCRRAHVGKPPKRNLTPQQKINQERQVKRLRARAARKARNKN